MSISVTVSGDESTSVISSQLNTGSISVSGSESIQVTSAGVNSASVTISTGDPVTITGNFSTFVTGSVVRPDDISSFITSSNLSALETATGDLNTRVNSNDSDITSLNSATGVLNTATGALSTATGLLVPKSETGSFLTSGQIDTNISTAVSNLVDSAPSTLDTLNELASGLGNDPNFATTITVTLGNKVNKSETGSFAVTGSDVTFSNLTVTGDILPENNVVSDIGSPSKRFKDLYLSGNSIFLGDSRLSFTPGATGGLNITGQGTTGRFIQDVETGSLLSPLETSTGLLNTATGTLSTATGELNTATGSLSVATGALNTATGSLSSATGSLNTATGTLNTNIGTVSGLITSNDSDIADLNTATGLLTGATGALSTATGVLQGVTGSFAQTGSGDFGVLNVTGNILLGDGIIDTADGDKLHFGTNDLIANGKHIQAGFSVGVFGNRGNVKGMNQGAANSSDLGLFCNSIEGLSIQTGGNVIVNTGNLGIGTTSPDTQLHIKSTGDVSLKLEADTDNVNENHNPLMQFIQDSGLISANVGFNGNTDTEFTDAIDNAFYIENTSSAANFGAIQFASNNQAQLTILSGGNVGIGTNAPSAKLHVSGNTLLSGNLTTSGTIQIASDGSSSSDNSPFSFEVSADRKNTATTALYIYPTDTTNHRVFFQNPAQDRNMFAVSFAGASTLEDIPSINGLSARDSTTSSDNFGLGSIAGVGVRRDGGTDNFDLFVSHNSNVPDFVFHAKTGGFFSTHAQLTGGAHEIMRLTNEGNLGIGTNSPQEKLHVAGDSLLSGVTTVVNNLQLSGNIQDLDGGDLLTFNANDLIVAGKHIQAGFGVGVFENRGNVKGMNQGLGNFGGSSSDLGLFCNSIEALSIQTDGDVIVNTGNLGIGTNAPESLLTIRDEVGGKSLLIEGAGGNNVAVLGTVSGFTNRAELLLKDGSGPSDVIKLSSRSNINNFVHNGGNFGIGTTSPQAKLHVAGSGIITSNFAVDTNTLFVDASANGVGIRTSSPRNLYALHVNDNFLVTNGNEDHLNIDTTSYIYKFGDISGGDNGSFFEINSANGVASISQAAFGIGVTLPQASLHVNGTATVSGGLTTLGKTTLSSDAFVIETGSFTLGNTHKGATVLLQNSASINITVPSQVSGYVTTFIAETHNLVSFITGSGMSGLNSFNGASDIAGIYGQAQVIYKSSEFAFLGGNIV